MSDELFYKIIREGKELGATIYYPFMNGEPFMFSRIWKWLDYMEKEGVTVALHTNAELVDVDRLVKYKNIKYLYCSLHAATEETYNKVVRGPDFNRVKSNIDRLLRLAPFRVRVSFVPTEENIHEVDLFCSQYDRRVRAVGTFANWTGARRSSTEKVGRKTSCQTIFVHQYILWDGRVVPCCMDYDGRQILGDANKQSLGDIWEASSWFRAKHNRGEFGEIDICRGCNYNEV